MRAMLNLFFQLEDEATGEIIRHFKTDVYLDNVDELSKDYFLNTFINACDNAGNIIREI